MQGYYKQAGETKKVLKDGRLHTGDMGFLDAQGFLHIVDRLKEMIIVSGFKVYPRQVEEEIYRHPMVEEAAVIGVPHSKTGQQVKAYIKLKKDCFLDVDEMREYLAKNLTKYKQPKQIEFVDSLPKTLIGKIEKKKLRTDV